MYLPLGGSTLLRLLQLPLSLLNYDQPTLHSVLPGDSEQFEHHHSCNDLNNLGNISPYHDAPTVPGASLDLPDDCTVDQVILLHRHGSRGPVAEQNYILQLVDTLDGAREIIQAADLPPYLEFLKEGYEYQLVPEELTIVGRKELFDHGAEFALRYPTFSTDVVVSTTVQRVIDSAYFFAQGFFGLEAEDVTFLTTDDFDDPISWLDPWESCPKLPLYVLPYMRDSTELIPGVEFSSNDTRGALYACPYDLAARNRSPWCNVFSAYELQGLEYELDLVFDGFSGHASKDEPGPLIGAFYIKKLIERLTDTTENAEPLYLEFAHDLSILFTLSTMGLNKDALPISPTHPDPHRKFRTSHQTPFAANMVWEKFTCQKSFEGPQVRLMLNGVTLPLSICEKSEKDKKYGTCSLDEFVLANEYSVSVEYQSQVWNATCELRQP
ncbi:phosphoglycerate mutase-like protein [Lanmaoa asiatica]|nr:phosphoglycerate mutase-like protein [Lanmaoa asiatica]